MADHRTFRPARNTANYSEAARRAPIPRPDSMLDTCVHPRCHGAPQKRYRFPLPLCSEHLIKTLAAAVEVTRAAKLDYSKANPGKSMPFPVKARIPHGEVVYYIRFGDRIKIGTTSNLSARLSTLPFDEVLATEPGGVEVERQRHTEFAASRISGREWFTASEALLAHIASLKA
ncbi:GIY-YIG nuclease family protein [Nocardia sp. NPDC003963]